jgi:hypothetical protein
VPSGELGADSLGAYDVDLDFGANTLNLISSKHGEGNVLYWKSERLAKLPITVMENGKIYFTMTLDGHDLETVLNTGVPMSTLRMSTAKSLYDVDNDSRGNQHEGALGNGTALYSHAFKTMSIAGPNWSWAYGSCASSTSTSITATGRSTSPRRRRVVMRRRRKPRRRRTRQAFKQDPFDSSSP